MKNDIKKNACTTGIVSQQPVNIEFPPAKAGRQQSEEKGELREKKS